MRHLILAGAACLGLVACNAADYATPEQQEQLIQSEQEIEGRNAELEALQAKLLEQGKQIAELAAAGAEAKAELDQAAADFAALELAHETVTAERDDLVAEQVELREEILKPQTDALVAVGGHALPPGWQAPLGIAAYLATRFFSKRGSRHLKDSAKHFVKGQLGSATASLLSSLGYRSGSSDSALESVRDQAIKEGDQQLAAAMQKALNLRAEARDRGEAVNGIPAPPQPPQAMTPGPVAAAPMPPTPSPVPPQMAAVPPAPAPSAENDISDD